ncbi:MAG: twin-arginine translocase subunit TatC [Planctomycetales bacterium]|nr:twin-arginine translocase subunit TatC [Planctomycetales bacterium]
MLLRSDKDLFEQSKMSFGEHLEELRIALWKCVLALALGTIVGFILGKPVLNMIQGPLQEGLDGLRISQTKKATGEDALEVDGRTFIPLELYERTAGGVQKRLVFTPLDQDPRTQAIGTGVPDALMVYMKASLVVGVVVSSPALFYFIWSFVASGLYAHERAYVYTFMPFSLGLFLLGAAVAFFFAVKLVVDFLFTFYDWLGFAPMPRINEWLSFVLMLPLGFGVAFQLPLVMLFLERIGVFTVHLYQGHWKIAILVICVLSMILTPQDPGSMLLLAVPLVALYFGGIALCRFMPRRTTPLGNPIE